MKFSWAANHMNNGLKKITVLAVTVCAFLQNLGLVFAQNSVQTAATAAPGQVVITGTVPDDVSKLAILTKLREVYGADKVVDQISIGAVVMPPNWNTNVQKLINPNLKLIKRGQFKVDGTVVSMRGEVSNEAQKQQIASEVAGNLNPSYVVNNGLRITASDQGMLDQTLANRVIEFEIGKSDLTFRGKQILDEMAGTLQKLKGQKVEVIGHTDDQGLRASNVALSQARAETVKTYFSINGIDAKLISASGVGPDRPIASNATGEGRARNRRIEFRLSQ
jgi:OmpA-OmpF porin, OOP family